jgi:hypothetical protein
VSINPAAVKSKIAVKSLRAVSELDQTYAPVYRHVAGKHVDEYMAKSTKKADEPTVTTDVIIAGLFSSSPDARYFVAHMDGLPASLAVPLMSMLPTYLVDAIFVASFPKPPQETPN